MRERSILIAEIPFIECEIQTIMYLLNKYTVKFSVFVFNILCLPIVPKYLYFFVTGEKSPHEKDTSYVEPKYLEIVLSVLFLRR